MEFLEAPCHACLSVCDEIRFHSYGLSCGEKAVLCRFVAM